ncbi:MAG: cytochrome b/b6 domain-containing protein [Gammaproteobacteria bacterium]|nr:cytochrome b/b6 domain-containing protein [Gammaproteobacteria bacterium]
MNNEIRVWDPLIRIFHWSLVLAFSIAYLTGEEESNLHIYAGYIVLGLIIFRVVWGIIGTQYARFGNFVYSPKIVIQYLKALVTKNPKHYIGHNPAGGAMVIAMLLCLIVVSVSGLKVYAIEEGLGPLAGDPSVLNVISTAYADDDGDGHDDHEESENEHGEDEEELWEEIHEVSSNFMLLLIFLHIAGVIVSGRLHNEHLVKAMITGKKVSKTDA